MCIYKCAYIYTCVNQFGKPQVGKLNSYLLMIEPSNAYLYNPSNEKRLIRTETCRNQHVLGHLPSIGLLTPPSWVWNVPGMDQTRTRCADETIGFQSTIPRSPQWRKRLKELDCLPSNRERELGLDRRETG